MTAVSETGARAERVLEAYRHCERVVREEARNFSYGIRLMPAPKRRAMSAIYAFARGIDDVGDGPEPACVRLDLLDRSRRRLQAVQDVLRRRADVSALEGHPVLTALADAAARYPIPLDAFGELIDGCEDDVRGADYETFDDLLRYCQRVAGTVGRLSLGVFGSEGRQRAEGLADSLGVALQLTNILRDMREDRLAGRIYIPAEDLKRFRCTLELDESGMFVDPPWRLNELIGFQAERARAWYAEGLRLLPLLDRRSAACTAAMAGIYRRLLEDIAARPEIALQTRASLPTWQKAVVAARALWGAER
ncbi:farnesyl-diphosphate farnesyltransferase [Actinomadura hallensis]|uniref:Farnesyl-diphosphate farnesyltransferase n=1 Tax=Actinomadura hallensis TaxID=337895 RepID=A0A543ICM7_9ACTN|nr:squalene/phytoene synthase family protein [Actinomadura hallensis]TQM68312.1 farnesyl-diphosphate farnesyltransferase [Actinomadura hallensis]HLV72198.1 squalene/phytoene synthase family protein [Vulgatibacteraceae bacterium]